MKINIFCQAPGCQKFEQREYTPGEFIEHFWCEEHKNKTDILDEEWTPKHVKFLKEWALERGKKEN